jgi:hypothetical protein
MINHAFRQHLPLDTQLKRAMILIGAGQDRGQLEPSNPQVSVGSNTAKWLNPLEEREPRSTSEPVGQSPLGLGK